ncbi:MAG: ABC transporter permease [Armatimonadetes bacterium]|nr:ABC transporter permease [Armatimonadota bacterium]MDW8154577.1 ABC transporter permease [Armatimonadota bacterium]
MRRVFGELVRYRSAVAGLVIIGFFVILSVYAVVAVPYPEAIRLWRGGEEVWQYNPRNARPEWVNWFLREDLPRTLVVEGTSAIWSVRRLAGGVREVVGALSFTYPYRRPPSELAVFLQARHRERAPQVELSWVPPDGVEIRIAEFAVRGRDVYRLSTDQRLQQELGGRPEVILFSSPDRPEEAVPGRYALQVRGYLFEPDSEVEVRLVAYGEVHGVAGTDHLRRDLSLALLWGTPVAMAFGLVASVGSSVSTLVIAALGAWYGGWVDGLIQRITEVNLILPGLPILIMVATLYSRSLWVIVGVVILLGIFGGGIKTYRALFLQVKEAPYVEAARAYGARGMRIVFLYMVPRAVPVLVPQFVTLIPGFVFLEATLSVLGLGDPLLPTWGKVIEDAYRAGALYVGQYYWVLEPAVLLMLAGLGFTLLGFALDRVFNPRLREL